MSERKDVFTGPDERLRISYDSELGIFFFVLNKWIIDDLALMFTETRKFSENTGLIVREVRDKDTIISEGITHQDRGTVGIVDLKTGFPASISGGAGILRSKTDNDQASLFPFWVHGDALKHFTNLVLVFGKTWRLDRKMKLATDEADAIAKVKEYKGIT